MSKQPHPESTPAVMVQTPVWLTREQHDSMTRICAQLGIRPAVFLRHAVDLAIAEKGGR